MNTRTARGLTLAFAVGMMAVMLALGFVLHARFETDLTRAIDMELRSRAQVILAAIASPLTALRGWLVAAMGAAFLAVLSIPPLREFFAVTLPGLRAEILVAFVLTTINALRSFDIVYNTTAGGPGGQTLVPSMYMYQNAFLYNKVGYAAAVATILAVTIFVLAAIVLRVGDRSERA